MSISASSWETAYQNRPSDHYGETGHHHEDCDRLHNIFQETGVNDILDLGCGDGRHLVYFANLGYAIHGLDIARTAIALATDWLTREGLSADLQASEMTTLPWADNSFDAVISVQVINHNRIAGIRQTIKEIDRVLRPGGLVFVTVSTQAHGPGIGGKKVVEVEPNTFIPKEGHEEGVPHYQFDIETLLHAFSGFQPCEDLMPIHTDTGGYTCVLWRKPV